MPSCTYFFIFRCRLFTIQFFVQAVNTCGVPFFAFVTFASVHAFVGHMARKKGIHSIIFLFYIKLFFSEADLFSNTLYIWMECPVFLQNEQFLLDIERHFFLQSSSSCFSKSFFMIGSLYVSEISLTKLTNSLK